MDQKWVADVQPQLDAALVEAVRAHRADRIATLVEQGALMDTPDGRVSPRHEALDTDEIFNAG